MAKCRDYLNGRNDFPYISSFFCGGEKLAMFFYSAGVGSEMALWGCFFLTVDKRTPTSIQGRVMWKEVLHHRVVSRSRYCTYLLSFL